MADLTSTRVLLERYHSGDSDALDTLYGRYTTRVLAVVRARMGAELRQRVQSWDIVQEAMMASFQDIQKFDYASEGAFLKWLTTIVENRILDHLDYQQAACRDYRKEFPLENGGSPSSVIRFDPSDKRRVPTASCALILNEELGRLERALDRLPAETRELIIAVKLEGRTFQELADEAGKSPDAVRMQVNRAMAALAGVFRNLEAQGAQT